MESDSQPLDTSAIVEIDEPSNAPINYMKREIKSPQSREIRKTSTAELHLKRHTGINI